MTDRLELIASLRQRLLDTLAVDPCTGGGEAAPGVVVQDVDTVLPKHQQ